MTHCIAYKCSICYATVYLSITVMYCIKKAERIELGFCDAVYPRSTVNCS